MFVTSRHSEYFDCEGAKSVFKAVTAVSAGSGPTQDSRQGRLLLLLGKKKLLAAAPLLAKGGAVKAIAAKGATVGKLKGLGGVAGVAGVAGEVFIISAE
ncbi:hypothetical protein FJT64_020153 [Amphibalanus amphitrite]|uniref:Uncharacterized protein n=1 Tax=Amphibalanus amphitrite TaxID=1232801 RepID=A0A6A4WMS3_AMPAM|nr:hypothetical protein FJT64_020153 [Amphibalanus amphitrite]